MPILAFVLIALAVIAAWFVLYFNFSPRIGANAKGARLARIQASPNFKNGKFQNPVATNMDMPPAVMAKVMWEMLKGGNAREPKDVIPTDEFDRAAWEALPDTGIAVAWFGHSSLLIKLDGVTILTDPVFGERASSFSFAGPKRFRYTHQMRVELLPRVDVVLLSHDHYDHLCHETTVKLVKAVGASMPHFIAPLGVGAHLEMWGVPPASITEKDLWESTEVGTVEFTLAPTRHFSGRGLTNRFSTLWGGWVLEGASKKIYFGADSGYCPAFKEVGERFGPFDLAFLECGAYNEQWADIHMRPEQTAQAATDEGTSLLMPIHWGKFNLALHPWKEPVTRITAAANAQGTPLLTPRIGRIIADPKATDSEPWWDVVG